MRVRRQRRLHLTFALACVFLFASGAAAADPSRSDQDGTDESTASPAGAVEELVVRARRPDEALVRVPLAVSVLDRDDVQLGQPQLTLAESLAIVPGVFVQNRSNFAQDARISIRGFGARASFGLRGIRLYVDGIPQTLPDGQGQVDTLSLPTVGRIEVMRGPASMLYGPAAGGVILVETESPGERPMVSGRAAYGSFGQQGYDAKASARMGRHDLVLGYARQSLDGYRDHAHMVNNQLTANSVFRFDASTDLTTTLQLAYSPEALDPGGLTAAQVEAEPTAARTANVERDAGESVSQATLGTAIRRAWSDAQETTLRGYFTWRAFDGRLPIQDRGQIDLDRLFGGGSLQHEVRGSLLSLPNRLVVGVEGSAQRDDRQRYENLLGGVRGALQIDQLEDVSSIRAFATDEWSLPAALTLVAGVSYDHLFYAVDDRLQPGGVDGSGQRDFGRASPMVSLGWAPSRWANPYARFATSFEPPTSTELANNTGTGFVSDLDAQRAMSWELGMKGAARRGEAPIALSYELAAYHIESYDEIVPQGTGDLATFVNAGRTRRTGVETMLELEPAEGLRARFAYTFGVSKYVEYVRGGTDYAGQRIPGIPDHVFTFDLRYVHQSGFWGAWETRFVSDVPVDDANSASAPAYTVHGLRFGWTGQGPGPLRVLEFAPYVGIENITDAGYIDNVRINAFGGRYYEPAPALSGSIGLRLTHHFGAAD